MSDKPAAWIDAGKIGIQRVDHVQINVADLEPAKRFYAEVAGLTEILRPASFDFAGAWYRMGNMDLHLVVRPSEADSPRHFCLYVDDVQAAAKRFESAGYKVAWEQRYKINLIDRFFIRDPAGNRIEVQGPDEVARMKE